MRPLPDTDAIRRREVQLLARLDVVGAVPVVEVAHDGDALLRWRVRIGQQPPGVDLLPPQEFLLTVADQVTVTRDVALPVPTPSVFQVLVSAFNLHDVDRIPRKRWSPVVPSITGASLPPSDAL